MEEVEQLRQIITRASGQLGAVERDAIREAAARLAFSGERRLADAMLSFGAATWLARSALAEALEPAGQGGAE